MGVQPPPTQTNIKDIKSSSKLLEILKYQSELRKERSKPVDKNKVLKAYAHILAQLQEMEDEDYDTQKLFLKQLHMRQLMGLRAKGRYLEETKMFDADVKCLPSLQSQKKAKKAFDLECQGKLLLVQDQLKEAENLEARHVIVNKRISNEYFYFNPIYNTLLNKRNQVLKLLEEQQKQAELNPDNKPIHHHSDKSANDFLQSLHTVNSNMRTAMGALQKKKQSLTPLQAAAVSQAMLDKINKQKMNKQLAKHLAAQRNALHAQGGGDSKKSGDYF